MSTDKLKLRSTRKAYFHIYAVPVAVFITLELLTDYVSFNNYVYIFIGAIAAASIAYSELDRWNYWIEIDETGVTVEKGLLRKKRLIVPRQILTDMDIKQSVFQRLLRFGQITMRSFSEDHRRVSICINKPHDKMKEIRELIKPEEGNVRPQAFEGA